MRYRGKGIGRGRLEGLPATSARAKAGVVARAKSKGAGDQRYADTGDLRSKKVSSFGRGLPFSFLIRRAAPLIRHLETSSLSLSVGIVKRVALIGGFKLPGHVQEHQTSCP